MAGQTAFRCDDSLAQVDPLMRQGAQAIINTDRRNVVPGKIYALLLDPTRTREVFNANALLINFKSLGDSNSRPQIRDSAPP